MALNATAEGYKLLGEIQEASGKKELAIVAYEKSLELDINQEELLNRREYQV